MAMIIFAVAGCISLVLLLNWSWWITLLSTAIFVFGLFLSDYILRYVDSVPNLMEGFWSNGGDGTWKSAACTCPLTGGDGSSMNIIATCNVCGSDQCRRVGGDEKQPVDSSSSQVTTNSCSRGDVLATKIPKIVDDALQEFFDLTVAKYVNIWYEAHISREDRAFFRQVRAQIRRALSRLLISLRDIDLASLILNDVLPVAIGHANIYSDVMRHNSQEEESLEELVLERLSNSGLLHPAMRSRSCELSHLKRLVDCFVARYAGPGPSPATLSLLREVFTFEVALPVVDAIADPNVVNHLLILFFDPLPMRTFDGELSEQVVLLDRFVDEKNHNMLADTVVFQCKLSEIIRDPPMLYVFMTYLKSINGPMNWLQFVLSAYDIQERIHSGRTLTREEISHLHWQSWELYRNYLHDGAPDKLGDDLMPVEVIEGLKAGVEAEHEEAITRISPFLEQAYQIMYQLVQLHYVGPFCQSAEFMEVVCAARRDIEAAAANAGIPNSVDEMCDGAAGILEKGAMFAEYLDTGSSGGSNSCDFNNSGSEQEESEEGEDTATGVLHMEPSAAPPVLKDLSQWKVSLPRIEPRRDRATGRTMYVYVVEVESSAEQGPARRWCIDRRYREFYVLESKMVEFHGESVLGGFPLPAKKTFNNKSRAFVESQRLIFDHFLKRLLHNQLLNKSELLYTFLTSSNELTTSLLPDPFKVMRKVPGKFSRERGQNLSSFLQSLVSSVNETTPGDVAGNDPTDRTLFNPLSDALRKANLQERLYSSQYKNNFGSLTSRSGSKIADELPPSATDRPQEPVSNGDPDSVSSVYDALLFLAFKVHQISYLTWAILVSARFVLKRTFDGYVSDYVRDKLSEAMHEQRLAELIYSLRDLVFKEKDGDDQSKREDDSRASEQRRIDALTSAQLYFDNEMKLVKKIVGPDSFNGALKLMFDCLQCPRLNKQLFYVLLDVAGRKLFPDLP